MTDEVKGGEAGASVDETKKPAPVTTEEKSIGEIINDDKGTGPKPASDSKETVPLAVFLDMKKDNKQLADAITELQKQIIKGGDVKEASAELTEIATELGIDPKKLEKVISAEVARKTAESIKPFQETEKRIQEREGKLSAREKEDQINKVFAEHFGKAIERMPEYKDLANADVIKELSLLPKNANKTFSQLIEETYGNAVTGKRTIATEKKPAGGKEPEALDIARAKRDTEYFNKIMADPVLKKKYNDQLFTMKRR